MELYCIDDIRPLKLKMHMLVKVDYGNSHAGISRNLADMNIENLGENYINMKMAEKAKQYALDGDLMIDEEVVDVDEGVDYLKRVEIKEMMFYAKYAKKVKNCDKMKSVISEGEVMHRSRQQI